MKTVEVFNVGKLGVNSDEPPHTLPPEAWSAASNIRFSTEGAGNFRGESQVFGTLLYAPAHVLCVPAATIAYWIYLSKTKAAVYEGGVHTNITRQSAGVDVNYTAVEERDWQSTLFGGVPIINNGNDVPQFWGSASASTKLADLTGWPSGVKAKQLKTFGRFLIALNLTESGSSLPQSIRWSHSADPGSIPSSWDLSNPALDAGRLDLTDALGGEIIDAFLLGNTLVIYKANSTHVLRFIGGQDIFAPDLLFSTSGLLAPKCACEFDKGKKHFVVTPDDIIIHSGTKDAISIVEGKNLQRIFDTIDPVTFRNAFTFENPAKKEVFFAYPESGSTRPNRAFVYNYKDNTSTFRSFTANTAAYGFVSDTITGDWDSDAGAWDADITGWSDEGRRAILLGNSARTKIYKLDQGYQIDDVTPTAELERTGLAIIGRDRQGQPKVDYYRNKIVNRVWPKITGSAIVRVQMGVQENFNTEVAWSNEIEFDPLVDKYLDFDPPIHGRLLAIRFRVTAEKDWQLEGYTLEMDVLGNL